MLFNVRTTYSLLHSTLNIDDYIHRAKHYGYQSIGIADENTLHAVVEFYQKAKKNDLIPLIGMTMKTKALHDIDQNETLILYAKNYKGYQQLLYLSYLLSMQVDVAQAVWDYLNSVDIQLIVITAGKETTLEKAIFAQRDDEACNILKTYQELFGKDNVYLGLSAYPFNQRETELLHDFSKRFNLKIVMNQLVNMLDASNAFSLKVLEAIQYNEQIDLSFRQIQGATYLYPVNEFEVMYQLAKVPNILTNSKELAESLMFDFPMDQAFLPKFKIPDQWENSDSYLRHLIETAISEKGINTQEYIERANYELSVISQMGFSDYFLIVWELMDYCQKNGIRTGPGRGSAAGALVSYLLNITSVDPLKYDLLFERFLNPERHNMPDIDLDIPDNKRDLVLQHIEEVYGHASVAQIGTFGTFGAKQAIRDTLRVLGFSTDVMSNWSKAIPRDLDITLKSAYTKSAPLRDIVNSSEQNKQIFQVAMTIEGQPRHISTHAAGVIIHDAPLYEVIPLLERPHQMSLSQFTMYDVERVGLLKLDILGLRNLSLLEDVVTNVERLTGNRLEVNEFPMDDQQTLQLFRDADTNGVFQFESDGIKNVLRKVSPTRFEDIVAVNALYRPGPMAQIDEFVRRKKKQVPVNYLHPILESILKSTYGIIVYQEQVLQICQQMGGFSLGQADLLRRAMAKKQEIIMINEREHFIEGASKKGINKETATQVYDHIYAFAEYGFNKSHAVVYSTLAYQLAYLKTHYPVAFYQAVLNQGRSNLNTFADYIEEAKRRLGKILSVDINCSLTNISIDHGHLRIGFESVKGLRKELIQHIMSDRQLLGEYEDITAFLSRLPKKLLKFEWVEMLIKAGAFDSTGQNRATLMDNLPKFIQSAEFSGMNLDLFQELAPKIEQKEDWNIDKLIYNEKAALGFTLAPHPLDRYQVQLQNLHQLDNLANMRLKQKIKTIVYIQSIRQIETKKGDYMAFVTVDTGRDTYSLVVFPELFLRIQKLLKPMTVLYMEGVVDKSKRGELQVIVNKFEPVAPDSEQKMNFSKCFIKITKMVSNKEAVEVLGSLSAEYPGPCRVIIVNENKQTWQLDDEYNIGFGSIIQAKLRGKFGNENVVFR